MLRLTLLGGLQSNKNLTGSLRELTAFNDRIAELASLGHRSPAIGVLKAQALSLAAQIDELRGLLAVPKGSAFCEIAGII